MKERDPLLKAGKIFVGAWLVGALFSVALAGGVIYVIWHFMAKFW